MWSAISDKFSILAYLRALVGWLYTCFFFTGLISIYLISFKRISYETLCRAYRFWGLTVLKILRIRFIVENPSTLEGMFPRVVICNHQSALDLAVLAAICPPGLLAIGKKEMKYVPIFNIIWWAFDFLLIDRSDPKAAIDSMRRVAETLKKNKRSLVIAPEGTRSFDDSIGPFKKGAFYIALQSGIPLYPVVISGGFRLLSKNSLIPRPGKIRLRFLPSVDVSQYSLENVGELVKHTRDSMIEVFNQLKESEEP